MRVELTRHAVERFVRRVRPDLDYAEALRVLSKACEEAPGPMRARSIRGDAMLLLRPDGSPPCVLVLRRNHRPTRGSRYATAPWYAATCLTQREAERSGPHLEATCR